jgi:hypothetical protein
MFPVLPISPGKEKLLGDILLCPSKISAKEDDSGASETPFSPMLDLPLNCGDREKFCKSDISDCLLLALDSGDK